MRLKTRSLIVLLLVIGCLFLFYHSKTTNTKKYRQLEDRQNVHIAPSRHIIQAKSTTIQPAFTDSYTSQRIVYNRVPKCGSRSLLSLFKELAAKKNDFRVIEPASNYPYQLPHDDQRKISDLLSALRPPFIYHRHMHYIDFSKLRGPSVTYINLVRDPISRAVSHFYFRRYGDGISSETRARNPVKFRNLTYDECVLQQHNECVGNWGLFFIVPFFCGHTKACRTRTRWALEEAKKNVAKYLVVGVLEEYDAFLKVLEKLLPHFFHGAYDQSKKRDPSLSDKFSRSETRRKQRPSERVVALVKAYMSLEYEFYDFVKKRFHKLKKSLDIQ